MRPLFLLLAFLACACTGRAQFHVFSKKKTDTTAAVTGFGAPKPVVKKKRGLLLPLDPFYVFTGKLKDTAGVFLWLSIRDSVVKGEVIYRANGDTERVFGTVEPDGRLLFCGFSGDANMTGAFVGKIFDDTSFQGKWMALSSAAATMFTLYKRDTVPQRIDTTIRPDSVDGTYSYRMGDQGPAGGILIHRNGRGAISIDMGCAGGAPDFSSAMIKSPDVPFDGKTAVYQSPNNVGCSLRIRVFKDFVVINQRSLDKLGGCHYNTSVEGVFARTR